MRGFDKDFLQSGKAGGFLALNWCDGSASEPLARRSYQLHQQLAVELGADKIGYRAVSTMSGVLSANCEIVGGLGSPIL